MIRYFKSIILLSLITIYGNCSNIEQDGKKNAVINVSSKMDLYTCFPDGPDPSWPSDDIVYNGWLCENKQNISVPTEIVSNAVGENFIEILWRDTNEFEDGYIVEKSEDGIVYNAIANLERNIITYKDYDVNPATSYYYRIKTYAELGVYYGESESSVVIMVTTSDDSNISTIDISDVTNGTYGDKIAITWKQNDNFKYYTIYRCDNPCDIFNQISTSLTDCSFIDAPVSPNKYYYYKIKGITQNGEIVISSQVRGYAGLLPLETPENIDATKGEFDDQVLVTWDTVDNAEYYSIYKSIFPDKSYSKIIFAESIFENQYVDKSVLSGTAYYYKVVAHDASGSLSCLSNYSKGYAGEVPLSEPQNIIATDGAMSDKIQITWNSVVGADYYIVYRTNDINRPYNMISDEISGTSFIDESVETGINYFYTVIAFSLNGQKSHRSLFDEGYAGVKPVQVPTNIYCSKGSYENKIFLSWMSGDEHNTYIIYRSDNMDGEYSEIVSDLDKCEWIDNNIKNGKFYYYKLKVLSNDGRSSSLSDVYIGYSGNPFFSEVISLTASNLEFNDKIELSWNLITDADYYEIFRSNSLDDNFIKIADNIVETKYNDTNLPAGQINYYRIRSCKNSGEKSEFSNIAIGVVRNGLPSSIESIAATDGIYQDRIVISFDNGSTDNNLYYQINRSDSINGVYTPISEKITSLQFEDYNVEVNKYYYYKVNVYDEYDRESGVSIIDRGYIENSNISIEKPGDLMVLSSYTDSEITLFWPVIQNAFSYIVFRSEFKDGEYSLLSQNVFNNLFEDKTVLPNKYYYYKIKAIDVNGRESVFSDPIEGYIGCNILHAPQNVTATCGSNSDAIHLSWTEVDNASEYVIYRSDCIDSGYRKICIGTNETSYIDKVVLPDKLYYYKIVSHNEDNNSYSKSSLPVEGFAATSYIIIQPPVLINASKGDYDDRIYIKWDTNNNAYYYKLYRSDQIDGEYIKICPNLQYPYFFDTSVEPDIQYYYKVKVVNIGGAESVFSDISYGYASCNVNSSTLRSNELYEESNLPDAPFNVTATDGISYIQNKIIITWDDPVPWDHSYDIYRSDFADGAYIKINSNPVFTVNYIDETAPRGEFLYYKVKAVNNNGFESEFSNFDEGLAGPEIDSPTMINASDGEDLYIKVTWDYVPNSMYYNIYRSEYPDGPYVKKNKYRLYREQYLDTTIEHGITYYYKICALDYYDHESLLSDYDDGFSQSNDIDTLSKPVNFTASQGEYNDKIVLHWDPVDGADFYRVYYFNSILGGYYDFYEGYSSQIFDTTYEHNYVSPGFYYYKVRAFSSFNNGKSLFSETAIGYINSTQSNFIKVSGFKASDGDYSNKIFLKWNASEPCYYNIYRSESLDGLYVKINTDPIESFNFIDEQVYPEKYYYYKIRAITLEGDECELSDADQGYAKRPPVPKPPAPFNLYATDVGQQIQLTWETNDTSIKKWNIYRSDTGVKNSFYLLSTVNDSKIYIDSSANIGQYYYYYVTAINEYEKESNYSNHDRGSIYDNSHQDYPSLENVEVAESNVGEIKGNISVGRKGDAEYCMPLILPPGTANISPKLSIIYNSQAKQGLLGIKWDLAGLYKIERCAATLEQDGFNGSINYNKNDRFMINGNRLIAIKGEYGEHGTEYRTERDTFQKIISYEGDEYGPGYFKVWTKSGLVIELGTSDDARILVSVPENPGQRIHSGARVWAVNKIYDRSGNYYTVSYLYNEKSGDYCPEKIMYTGNSNTNIIPYNTIEFEYDTISLPVKQFKGGSAVSRSFILSKVNIYSDDHQLVKNYNFTYTIKPSVYSRLTTITECSGSGICLPATRIKWSQEYDNYKNNWEHDSNYSMQDMPFVGNEYMGNFPSYIGYRKNFLRGFKFIDLNGDGLVDFQYSYVYNSLRINAENYPNYKYYAIKKAYLNTGKGWKEAPQYNMPFVLSSALCSDLGGRFVDLNGDGLLDFVYKFDLLGGTVDEGALINLGNGWRNSPTYTPPCAITGEIDKKYTDVSGALIFDYQIDMGTRFVDLNGDGLTDVISSREYQNGDVVRSAYINNGSDWGEPVTEYFPPIPISREGFSDYGVRVLDINGDFLPDIVYSRHISQTGRVESGAYLNTGSGWSEVVQYTPPYPIAAYHAYNFSKLPISEDMGARFVDLNGDGLLDFVYNVCHPAKKYETIYDYYGSPRNMGAYYNTGYSWEKNPGYNTPFPISSTGLYINGSCYFNEFGGITRQDLGSRFVDMNGDHINDLLISFRYYVAESTKRNINRTILNLGSRWDSSPIQQQPILGYYYNLPEPFRAEYDECVEDYVADHFADVDGDGFQDIIKLNIIHNYRTGKYDYNINVYKNPAVEDAVAEITTGLNNKISIEYSTTADKDIYTANMNYDDSKQILTTPVRVVKGLLIDTGNTSRKKLSYNYYGGMVNVKGRGFLGFKWIKEKDADKKITKKTEYHLDFPLTGLPEKITQYITSDNGVLSSPIFDEQNCYQYYTTFNNKVYVPFLKNRITRTSDPDGGLLKEISNFFEYDEWGNSTTAKITIRDEGSSFYRTINNQFNNNENDWLLGLLEQSKITKNSRQSEASVTNAIFQYDYQRRLLVKRIDEPGTDLEVVTKFTYDLFGNKTQIEFSGPDIASRLYTFLYDDLGQYPIEICNPLGQRLLLQYDKRFGKPVSITDKNGLHTFYWYDSFGRHVKTQYPDNTQFDLEIDWSENSTGYGDVYSLKKCESGKSPEIMYFDKMNRLVRNQTINFNGTLLYQDIGYDKFNRMEWFSKKYTDKIDNVSLYSFEYDILDRITKFIGPDMSTVRYEYSGNRTTIFDQFGRKKVINNNVLQKPTEVIDALSNCTKYKYNAFGGLSSVLDANGNSMTITYDRLGRQIKIDDPNAGVYEYKYNGMNELVWQRDSKSNITTYCYDSIGRLIKRTSPEGDTLWLYDNTENGKGVIARIVSENFDQIYTYDSLSRISSITTKVDEHDFSYNYEYDNFSRLQKLIYPSGFVVRYNYTDCGFIETVDNDSFLNNKVFWTNIEINDNDLLLHGKYGNGLETYREYDIFDRVSTIKTDGVQDLSQLYDIVGNVTNRADNLKNQTEEFTYDEVNRLTRSFVTGQEPKEYQYDKIGNVIYKTGFGNYHYNSLRPNAVTQVGEKYYSYDLNGNVISSGLLHIDYSSFNKPVSIEASSSTITYAYGPEFEKLKQVKNVGAKQSTIYYLGNYEYIDNGDEVIHRHYISNENETIGVYKTDESESKMFYIHYDLLGSIDGISDEEGMVVEQKSFDAYGQPRSTSWIDDSNNDTDFSLIPYGFTDHEHIGETGLVHTGGRLYDPSIGRFYSPDPLIASLYNPQSINAYSYGLNNPMTYTDPSGYMVINHYIDSDILPENNAVSSFDIKVYTLGFDLDSSAQQSLVFDYSRSVTPSLLYVGGAQGKSGLSWRSAVNFDFGRDYKAEGDRLYSQGNYGLSLLMYTDMWCEAMYDSLLFAKSAQVMINRMFTTSAVTTGGSVAPAIINPSSVRLARNLINSGMVRKANQAAHHIVAITARRAAPARAVLARFKIHLDDAVNGVFLNIPAHSKIHTNAYYNKINESLLQAKNRDQAIEILKKISQQLSELYN